ncbi:hypothetical protein RclHR1_00300034 [Rhizophagus clarus]|uniref:Uncharacterized protein n=1 Tax=Rhizophagus clarus TaxID=94130 RepID=A0A2Z6R5Z8_9GLOM|nr:hypothetical protein RclHR1_00300034 [Rhizophagus clarus]
MSFVSKSLLNGFSGFSGTYEEYEEYVEYTCLRHIMAEWKNRKDCFYAHKARPYLVDGREYSPKCGMAICYSCNQLAYLWNTSLVNWRKVCTDIMD